MLFGIAHSKEYVLCFVIWLGIGDMLFDRPCGKRAGMLYDMLHGEWSGDMM